MLSSTRSTRLPSSTSGSGVYLSLALAARSAVPFDERAADVAVAHQPLDRGNAQLEGHGVGRRLGRIGHRDDDRVGVERNVFEPGQLLAQGRSAEIDRAIVQRAGDVGEIDPLEEAMRLARRGGEPLDANSAGPATASVPGSSDRMLRKPRLASGTLSLAAPKSGPCSAMQSGRMPSGSRTTTISPKP